MFDVNYCEAMISIAIIFFYVGKSPDIVELFLSRDFHFNVMKEKNSNAEEKTELVKYFDDWK